MSPSSSHSDTSSSPRAFLTQPTIAIPALSSSPNGSGPGLTSPSAAGAGGRSYNPNNEGDRRERQRIQDLESAMALSRARSGSVSTVHPHPSFSGPSPSLLPHASSSNPPPLFSANSHSSSNASDSHGHASHSTHRPSHGHRSPQGPHARGRSSAAEDPNFPMLSETEEAEMSLARGLTTGYLSEDVILESDGEPTIHDYADRVRSGSHGGSSGHGSHHRNSHHDDGDHMNRDLHDEDAMRADDDARSIGASTAAGMMGLGGPGGVGGLSGMMQGMNGGFVGRNYFDYSQLESWAQEEKVVLGSGPRTPGLETGPTGASPSSQQTQRGAAVDDNLIDMSDGPISATVTPTEEAAKEHTFVRRRQRKLSQSNPNPNARRQGKLALFEGGATMAGAGANSSILGTNTKDAPLLPTSSRDSAQYDSYAKPSFLSANNPSHHHQSQLGGQAGAQERPYRFSFYSNALPATIHARSLSELPADGQSFEDLFTGRGGAADAESIRGGTRDSSGTATPLSYEAGGGAVPISGAKESLLSRAMGNRGNLPPSMNGGGDGGGNGGTKSDEPEGSTWWLDVLCPTDDEMKMLSRTFGIHPLTTEDIQMEETREKIELFRNYYLVCFRSFDQDPYSQTHLEPLNMYIIVFREGTLSFHFRGTPHPQNVRRRIKQLKDYIAVTSDWISYALIDDITDAFGPLIQSIEYEVDSIDELVLILNEAEQSDMLRRIGTCRKKVMGLLRLMGNKADVVKGLAKRCNENWSVAPRSDIGLYLSDIQDHLITMTQNLNHYEKILSRSHSNYLAAISVLMNSANNQTNEVLSRMTALGTILIPMNLVTGLWGMNVKVPGQDVDDNLHWFFSIVGCLIGFALIGGFVTYRLFKN